MIDVVSLDAHLSTRAFHGEFACMQAHQVFDRRCDVFLGEDALLQVEIKAKLLIDLVAAHLGKVVALGIEVEVLQQTASVIQRGGFARTQLAVNVEQSLVYGANVVLLEGLHHGFVLTETLADLLHCPAEGLE